MNLVWKPFLLGSLALGLVSPGFAPAEDAAGGPWISLFDGRTLEGWVRRSGFATFAVEDGAIVGTAAEGSGNTFLCTTREFVNFELQFDVRVDEGLNSGVQVRSKVRNTGENGRQAGFGGLVYGPEVEIEASPGRSGWIFGEATGLGWLWPEPAAATGQLPPHRHVKNGDWNQFRVLVRGARIQTFINGVPVADLIHPDVFQNHTSGFIGLKVHGTGHGMPSAQVRWRHLKLRELP